MLEAQLSSGTGDTAGWGLWVGVPARRTGCERSRSLQEGL